MEDVVVPSSQGALHLLEREVLLKVNRCRRQPRAVFGILAALQFRVCQELGISLADGSHLLACARDDIIRRIDKRPV